MREELYVINVLLFKCIYILELFVHSLKNVQRKLTLHVHNHRDIQGTVTIPCFAVVSAVTTSGHWHFQVEHLALQNSVGGAFAEPSEVRFRSCFRVALDSFRNRVHCHIDYLLRDCDIFRRNFLGKIKIEFLIYSIYIS